MVHEGVLAQFPMVDIRVTLYDGSYHPVDSSDMAFQIAGSQALKLGIEKAQPTLLEPVMSLQVRVPDSIMGDAISDLNTKRAKVSGMTPLDGTTVIEALAPTIGTSAFCHRPALHLPRPRQLHHGIQPL